MALPMMGSRAGTLIASELQQIHGQVQIALQFHLDGDPPERLHVGRVAGESIYRDASPGDRIVMDFVMGNVIKVERETA